MGGGQRRWWASNRSGEESGSSDEGGCAPLRRSRRGGESARLDTWSTSAGLSSSSSPLVSEDGGSPASFSAEEGLSRTASSCRSSALKPRRRVTDVACLAVFLLALSGLASIWVYGAKHGDVRRLYHGYNFLGELCGVGNMTSKPVLYWCRDPSDPLNLDLAHPICRESCPSSDVTYTACFAGKQEGPKVEIDDLHSFTVQRTYEFAAVQDYKSIPLMGMYCLPEDAALMEQITGWLQDGVASRTLLRIASFRNAWPLLVVTSAIAIALGFLNLLVLQSLASWVVYCSMAVLCATPCAVGSCLLYQGQSGAGGHEMQGLLGGLGGAGAWVSPEWRSAAGAGLMACGLVLALLCCCFRRAIATAVAIVRASSDCFLDLPSLALQPLLGMALQLAVLAVLSAGLAGLVSCGHVAPESLDSYMGAAGTPGGDVRGVFRSFAYHHHEVYFIVFYAFTMLWLCELVNASSQFVLAYAVQSWYFTPYREGEKKDIDQRPLCQAYSLGLVFHLGSFALGSFAVASTRLLRLIVGFIAKQVRSEGNVAAEAASGCCMCILMCLQSWIEFLNKNAYMDIAVNNSNFCSGARRAFSVLVHNMPEVGALNGACWIISLAGCGAITAIGVLSTFLLLEHVETFYDPASDWCVQDRNPILIAAGLVCFGIGHSFMMVFDMVNWNLMDSTLLQA